MAGRSPERAGTVILREGLIVYASEGAAVLAGRTPAQLVGRPFPEFIAPEQREAMLARYQARLRGEPAPPGAELALLLPGGGARLVEAHAERDGDDVLVHLRDLTQREVRRLRLEAVATLGVALQRELTEEAIQASVRDGLGSLGVSSALMRLEPGGVRILWAAVWPELTERFRALAGEPLDGYLGRWSPFAETVARDGYAFTDDWARDASRFVPDALAAPAREAVSAAGIAQAIAVRLDERRGASLVLVVAADWLSEDDAPAVRLFGAQLAAALDASRAIADLSRRNAQLGALNAVAELAGDATDLTAFFRRASELVRPVAGYAGSAIFVADEAAGALVRLYADLATAERDAVSERVALASPLGEVLRDRVARVVDVPFEGGGAPFLGARRFRSLAWVPLVARSRAVGLLAAGFDVEADVARAAVDLLSAVGAHYASAIESHGLVSDLRRRVAELTLLVDVSQASAQLDPVLLLEAALRRICETLGADVAAAYLRDGDRLALLSATGMDADCARVVAELDAGAGAPGLALRRRAPVTSTVGDAFGERCARLGRCGRGGPVIAVPLLAKAEAVGVVVLGRADAAPFGDDQAALLSSLGVQLGVAVDAARLFADVRRRLADLEAVHALAVRVHANAPGDLESLLQDGCRDIARALSAGAAAISLASEDRKTLRPAASCGLPAAAAQSTVDLARDAFSAEVMRTGQAAVSDDITKDPRSALRGEDVPPLAMIAVPLASRAEVRGVVYVGDHAGRRFTAGDVALANALAGALGVGVENAELYADARRRVEELFLLNEVGRAVAGSLDLDEVLREAAEGARRIVRTTRAYVLLYDAARGEMRFGAGAGMPARSRELRGPVPPGTVLEGVLRERRPAMVEDVERAPVSEAYWRLLGGRAMVVAPVLLRGEPIGALVADEERGPRRFSEADVGRLTAVADRLAVALENARLYLETRRRAEELGLLHEVGRSLVETLDIEQVLRTGVRNLARMVDAPEAHLALVGADGAHLEVRAVAGEGAAALGRRVPLDGPDPPPLAALAYHLREPIVVADARFDARVRAEAGDGSVPRAYLALPLVVRDRAIGTAVIGDTRPPRVFTPAEVERAAAIANQLAVAAENARLYEDLRRSYAQLARAQQQLIEGERLAALGELSAVVAHEVRNPLGVIFNSLGSLRRLVRPAGDAKMLLDIVEEEADRLNRIVGDLLDFARPSHPELRPEHLDRVVEDAVSAALAQQGGRIEILRELDGGVPPVAMDARLVRQAVLNVAVNAVQAMPRGGRIVLRTRRDGEEAVLEVEDSGVGIPEEVRSRIFEPFFTTKASGTGLGLAVVKRIVEGHGGSVAVRSEPGAGTVFALRFPLAGPQGP